MDSLRFDAFFDRVIEDGIAWLNDHFAWFFDGLRVVLDSLLEGLTFLLSAPSALLFIPLTALAAWRLSGRGVAVFAVVALGLCYQAGLWDMLVATLSLVFLSTFIALLIGIPLGIAGDAWKPLGAVLGPLMDTLQTLPPYVYLLPAIALVGFGGASAVIATTVLAIPPAVRLTMLGMRTIPRERLELGQSLGATPLQSLLAIRIPSALPSIMAGVNQSLMMSLGMAVIAGIIGAGGLGGEVYRAVRYLEVGRAFDAGLAIVVLSILLDRISEGTVRRVMGSGAGSTLENRKADV